MDFIGISTFRKLTIKQRLIIMFTLSQIFFIVFSALSVYGVYQIKTATENMYEHPLVVSNASLQLKVEAIKIHRDLKNILLSTSQIEIDTYIAQIENSEKDLHYQLRLVRDNILGDEGKRLAEDMENSINSWREFRANVLSLILSGKKDTAINISNTNGNKLVTKIEQQTDQLHNYARKKADGFMNDVMNLEENHVSFLWMLFTAIFIVSLCIFIITINSFTRAINSLKNVMTESKSSGILQKAEIIGENEISEMSKAYNNLIDQLSNKIWLKDGLNILGDNLSKNNTLSLMAQNSISFLARYLDAGSAVFFSMDSSHKKLTLLSSFACNQKDSLSNVFELGQGTIGQVALEQKPILLKNIKRSQTSITTGTLDEAPLNTYTFPLLYEDNLYGVIELNSFEPFDKVKQDFVNECSNLISINLKTIQQNEQILLLLKETEIAKNNAEELKNQAQKQSEELSLTNIHLEEQQQQLELQSEELQQLNVQLEEQQQALMNKTEDIQRQNVELEEKSRELQQSSGYKSEFLANMSHELRTPLNSIILLSKTIFENKNNSLSEKDIEKMSVINNAGNELLRLINDVLDISKIEAGKTDVNVTGFTSTKLCSQFKDMFDSFAIDKGLEFVIEDNIKATIYSDKNKVDQIVRNFLSNSFKFTHSGKVTLRILARDDENFPVEISVTDTGIGISDENIDKIFGAFQQIDGSISRKYGGTGLGLYICRQLAELIGGKIEAQSLVNQGSKFVLVLPKVSSADQLKKNNEINDDRYDIKPNDSTLLIIEDDIAFAKSVMEICKNLGIKTIHTSYGKDAITLAQKYRPVCILLDLILPDVDGLGILKELKSNILIKSIPVAIVSAVENNKAATLLGAEIFENKPIPYNKLVDLITGLTEFNKLDSKILQPEDSSSKYLLKSSANRKKVSMEGKNILIVDDDPKNIFVLATALEDFGAKIFEAIDGDDAISKLQKQPIDIVLLDIMMPKMDGYECIKRIREIDRIKDIPIIAITAKTLKGDKEKCIASGANDYISKPVDYNILINVVDAWLNNK